uniref:Integrase catalytic domain-containing protein n=1 Tax=Trichuris muris TaxID=70415 RepID=A0A5S6QHE2_TRIMR
MAENCVVDAFSKFAEALPMPNQETTTVTETLTKKTRTTPYHPSGNGQAERMNRTVWDMLAKSIKTDERDWDLLLPKVTMAYRATPHSSTGQTPYMMMFGRRCRMPEDMKAVDRPHCYRQSDVRVVHADRLKACPYGLRFPNSRAERRSRRQAPGPVLEEEPTRRLQPTTFQPPRMVVDDSPHPLGSPSEEQEPSAAQPVPMYGGRPKRTNRLPSHLNDYVLAAVRIPCRPGRRAYPPGRGEV